MASKAKAKPAKKVAAKRAVKPATKAKATKATKARARPARVETRGRKPLPEDQRTIGRSVRMPQPLWDKLEKMGGAARVLRSLVEKANIRRDKVPASA